MSQLMLNITNYAEKIMQKIEFIWLILKNDFFDDNIIV